MNRKQRRMSTKSAVFVPKYSNFDEKLQKMYEKGYQDGLKHNCSDAVGSVFAMMLGLPIKVLHDKYGWGIKKRLPEFAEAVIELNHQFEESADSVRDMQEYIYQTTGIKLVQVKDD